MRNFYLIFFFFTAFYGAKAQEPFIATLHITKPMTIVTFHARGTGYNYTIDFGDGQIETNVTGNMNHYFPTGIYTITMNGDIPRFPRISFNGGSGYLKSIDQWGDIQWQSMEDAFVGCNYLVINATDAPDLSQVTNLSSMFSNASSINQSIGHWDVSNITDMSYMFSYATSFNQSLNSWDVSNVEDMKGMFNGAQKFNQALNSWNVSNVSDMSSMFLNTEDFNQEIGSWDTSNVTTIAEMFSSAKRFNHSLNNWNVSNVTNMVEVFRGAELFNQSLNNWDVSNVTTMEAMFSYANNFNQVLDTWDVSSVNNLYRMFMAAENFDQPLGSWNVSNVANMSGMFLQAFNFNQSIGSWNVSNVSDMGVMFRSAKKFNQPLENWDVSQVENMERMFYAASDFDQSVNNWDISNLTSLHQMFYGARKFNKALSNWDVSNIDNMEEMFKNASSFNQSLANWNISNVTNVSGMFNNTSRFNKDLSNWDFSENIDLTEFISNSGMDISNYESLLERFDYLNLNNRILGANRVFYCNDIHRNSLINKGWTISGDALLVDCNQTIPEGAFVTRWEVTQGNRNIEIGIHDYEDYNYSIDFGDGTIENNVTGIASHTYANSGVYTVSITGDFPWLFMPYSDTPDKLISVEQWGDIEWTSMASSFSGCSNVKIFASDAPDLSQVTSLGSMFSGAHNFNESINHWDVSNITSMNFMFINAFQFNQPLDNWDVSNVTSMDRMFYRDVAFNQPLDSWDVSNVNDMYSMFGSATSFDQPLNNWDVSSVSDMKRMFEGAASFNQPLDDWNVSNVTNMSEMFGRGPYGNDCIFNHSLDSWDVSSVTDMEGMFNHALHFNQSLDSWDVSYVTNMSLMFQFAEKFNGSIGTWNVSSVTNMKNMFMEAEDFNQPLNTWDVSNVSDMSYMFYGASRFNQTLNDWDVSQVLDMSSMFMRGFNFNGLVEDWNTSSVTDMSKMFSDAPSFDQPLDNWDVSNVTTMESMFGMGTKSKKSIFNHPIDSWDVSNVTTMKEMFREANNFDQPLDSWDVSNVIDISKMFEGAVSFNQPLGNWDVSNVTKMASTFAQSNAFNQPLNNWNVSQVTNFQKMFEGASSNPDAYSFNQPLDSWDVSNALLGSMFSYARNFNQDLTNWQITSRSLGTFISNSGLDIRNYDALLSHFVTLAFENITLNANGLEYCNQGAREYLINERNWTIRGDFQSTECNLITGTILYDEDENGCDPNDMGVSGFMVNVNDGSNDYVTFSNNGNFRLATLDTQFTVSVINTPDYISVDPASANVTFTNSNVEEVDFCITGTQNIEDLNVRMLTISDARPGFEAQYQLIVENMGTSTVDNVSVDLTFDDDKQEFLIADPSPITTTNNQLNFEFVNLNPFSRKVIDFTMQTFAPPIVEGGDILSFTATVSPNSSDYTPEDNTYVLGQIVVNSYDPNDKQVMQGEEIYVAEVDNFLDYLIRFQNTGTASAINVRILDTLHPKLDWSTIRPINASHDYRIEISNGNKVEFIFDDIQLIHEAGNEPESHGWVAYKIKPKSNAQVGDVISGDARIYFDYNPPIITNTVSTVIIDDIVGVADNTALVDQIKIYPNPTDKTLNIYLNESVNLEEVIVCNLQGQEILKLKERSVDVGNLSDGIYLIKIITDQGTVNRRFIKM